MTQTAFFDNTATNTGAYQAAKLPAGWYDTTRYGPVFVNNGKAWTVQMIGNKMANVVVELSKDDIIGRSAIVKMKDVIKYRAWKRLQQASKGQ